VLIVIFVVLVGAFEVDVSNWSPFAPYGFNAIVTGATVVFFAYVGFDAVANSAEESKRPQVSYIKVNWSKLIVCFGRLNCSVWFNLQFILCIGSLYLSFHFMGLQTVVLLDISSHLSFLSLFFFFRGTCLLASLQAFLYVHCYMLLSA